MKLLFKQRFFSWFDSYDIFDEEGNTVYTVKGELSWGHKLNIYNGLGEHVGTVKQKVFTWMPVFELYAGGNFLGCLRKRFAFFRHVYGLDFNDWHIDGDFTAWNYSIFSAEGMVASIGKQLFNLTDTYVIDVVNPCDALLCLMFTLAVDAEKCSNGN